MAGDIVQDNERSSDELRTLTASLADADLARGLGNGWMVSTIFCHLAFWDRVVLRRIAGWQRDGFAPMRLNPPTVDSINDAAREISRAVSGREAARMALESAEAIDALVERLSPHLVDQIDAASFARTLRRSVHRREHLRRINDALGRA